MAFAYLLFMTMNHILFKANFVLIKLWRQSLHIYVLQHKCPLYLFVVPLLLFSLFKVYLLEFSPIQTPKGNCSTTHYYCNLVYVLLFVATICCISSLIRIAMGLISFSLVFLEVPTCGQVVFLYICN